MKHDRPDPLAHARSIAPRSYNYLHTVKFTYLVLQWNFHPCGTGFIIRSACINELFLTVRDLKRLHLNGAAEVVTDTFPTCWEVEVMLNDSKGKNAEDDAEDDEGDMYVR